MANLSEHSGPTVYGGKAHAGKWHPSARRSLSSVSFGGARRLRKERWKNRPHRQQSARIPGVVREADGRIPKPVRIVYRQHGGLHPNFAHAPTLTVYIWNTGSTHLRIVRLKIAAPSVAKDRMIETDLVASPHSALPSEQDVTLPVFVYQPEGLVDSAPRRFRWTKAYLFASVQ